MSAAQEFERLRPGAADAGLVAAIEALHTAGRLAWPDVALNESAWAAFVAERVAGANPEAIAALDGPGLYLAAAVLAGDACALDRFTTMLDGAARVVRSPVAPDDLRQALAERLLAAAPDQSPRLASYRGQGHLHGWVRTAAARLAINLRQSAPAGGPAIDSAEPLAAQILIPDAELGLLAARHRRELGAAFAAALGALSPRERNLLRFHFLQGVTGDALARMHGVTRRTIHRWLEDVRVAVLEKTRARLVDELALSNEDLDALIAALHTQLTSVVARALVR